MQGVSQEYNPKEEEEEATLISAGEKYMISRLWFRGDK